MFVQSIADTKLQLLFSITCMYSALHIHLRTVIRNLRLFTCINHCVERNNVNKNNRKQQNLKYLDMYMWTVSTLLILFPFAYHIWLPPLVQQQIETEAPINVMEMLTQYIGYHLQNGFYRMPDYHFSKCASSAYKHIRCENKGKTNRFLYISSIVTS